MLHLKQFRCYHYTALVGKNKVIESKEMLKKREALWLDNGKRDRYLRLKLFLKGIDKPVRII